MRIVNVNNKISFGYDKNLNKELKMRLKEYPDKKWADTLSSMNSYCNKLETEVSQTPSKENSSRYNDYLDMFLNLKQMLAGLVTITFDDFRYADREYKHYMDEYIKSGQPDDSWQKEVCDSLSAWTQETQISPTIHKNEKSESDNEKEVKDASITQKADGIKKSLIEIYTPTKSSPRGFADVVGMDDLKRDLSEDIVNYIKNPEAIKSDYDEYGLEVSKGLLLYGPPGCGKTYIIQALSLEADVPLLMLNLSNAGSHYINMTSKNIYNAFQEAFKTAEKIGKPCLLFMDEIDTLGFDRTSRTENEDIKQVGTLLQSIDNAKDKNIIVIGATNKYNLLDPAVKRRFENMYFVDLPSKDKIKSLLIKHLSSIEKGKKLAESSEKLDILADMLNGYSNSSVCIIIKNAAKCAKRRSRADIDIVDFQESIKTSNQEKPNRKDYTPDYIKDFKIGFI